MSVLDAEQKAMKEMRAELADLLVLAERVYDLLVTALPKFRSGYLEEISLSHRVAANLLIRLCNDLRVSCLLVQNGYPVQALAVVAASFEVSHTVSYIADDDQLALEWIRHDDPTRSFRGVKPLLTGSLTNAGYSDVEQQLNLEYRAYRQMCWAKHANPFLQRDQGAVKLDESLMFFNGPDTTPGGIRLASFTLQHVVRLSVVALASYLANHLVAAEREKMAKNVRALQGTYQQAVQAAIQRWGTEDPFPGRW